MRALRAEKEARFIMLTPRLRGGGVPSPSKACTRSPTLWLRRGTRRVRMNSESSVGGLNGFSVFEALGSFPAAGVDCAVLGVLKTGTAVLCREQARWVPERNEDGFASHQRVRQSR